MAKEQVRLMTLGVLTVVRLIGAKSFKIPDVTIEVFSPEGFRASIPEAPGIEVFIFEGNVDKEKKNFTHRHIGTLRGWGFRHVEGRWVFTDPARLERGDVVNYYVHVKTGKDGLQENLSFTVTEILCKPSITKVRGRDVCPGETIFEDQFSSNILKRDLWQVEQYIPTADPEYPFVSYQKSRVSVSNGYLQITPELQQKMPDFNNDSVYFGNLDLFNGCTANAEACFRQALQSEILPPVASGRVSSHNFAFTYGTVYIRARLPKGDWIYPDILLTPFLERYGRAHYASGVIKIASSRGNVELRQELEEYGNKVLYGGPIMDFQCRNELLTKKVLEDGRLWGDDFHEYSINWTPDELTLSVDGEEWARVDTTVPFHRRFPQSCSELPRDLLETGTDLAPFDSYFHLTFGVAVGGISEFKDGPYCNEKTKPWRNDGRKAMLRFWEALESWHQTWSQPELLVDYVKVVASNSTVLF